MTTTLQAPPAVSPEAPTAPSSPIVAEVRRRRAPARLLLGERTDPAWARPALWGLLVVTGILYLWNLADSGWANSFYAAAVQAGSQSWKALFFGSLDSSNFITVDKPPASLWIMGISARLFGFSSWSLLVPQALEGVAAVALLYGTVRRALVSYGPKAATLGGLLAGVILAFTPAAALMFRFDNPDALLVLLMTAGAYCVIHALPKGSGTWLALAGVALGFAFLTKMLQGLLVLPAFGLVYLMFANTTIVKRLVHLLAAAAALVVSAGWWVLATILWPTASRPYIGGSTNNTVLDLVFGYNGLARITGGSGSPGGGANGASGSSFGGATGLQRLFSSEMGLEISWLLPAALFALVIGLIGLRGRSHADPPGIRMLRGAFVLLGGWLLVTGVVFSFMSGTVHPYYTVALAPAIGGLVALGGVVFWRARERWIGRIGLAGLMVLAGGWSYALLNENPEWMPWLRWVVLVGSILSAFGVLFGAVSGLRKLVIGATIAGTLFGLGGTVAYSIATASVPHTGSIPSVGPSGSNAGGGFGGGTGGFGGGQLGPGQGSTSTGTSTGTQGSTGSSGSTTTTTTATSVDQLLKATTSRWAAAVDGSQSAATLELSSGTAVMAIGGWSSDPTPTLAEFQADVAAGDIGYYIVSGQGGAGGRGGPGGGTSTASAISSWVAANFSSETVGGSTVYVLTGD